MPKAVILLLEILIIIVLLGITIIIASNFLFNLKAKKEVKELFNKNVENKDEIKIIQKSDLEGLPHCIQKWLENSQVIGKEKIRKVRLKQKGFMRMKEGQPWMPINAEQYFTTDEPTFIWKAKIKAAPLLFIVGRDKYFNGKGNMLIKVLSLIKVVDAKGDELDQGTLVRYLAETVWFPSAALSSYIKWEEIDSNSAKATMSYKGITTSGIFMFNDKGDVINFEAERYMEVNGEYVMETWSTPMKEYKDFGGIRIPTSGEVIWKLKTGDFNWLKVEITEVEYNKPFIN